MIRGGYDNGSQWITTYKSLTGDDKLSYSFYDYIRNQHDKEILTWEDDIFEFI